MTKPERRHDVDSKYLDTNEPRLSLSDLLDKKRADALAKEAAAERADQVADIKERLSGPVTAADLERKVGGPDTDVIDKFFSDDSKLN